MHVHQQASLAEGHPPDPYQSTVKSLSAALVLVLMPGRTHSSAACQVHRVSMTAQQYIVPGNMAFLWRGAEGLDVVCVCVWGGVGVGVGGGEGAECTGNRGPAVTCCDLLVLWTGSSQRDVLHTRSAG